MRDLTPEESKKYRYVVETTVHVKRTDGALLTKEENAMVLKMHEAAEQAVAKVMAAHGSKNSKYLGKEVKVY